MKNSIKWMLPGLTLLLLAPVLGELVSAHQSPLEFINPLNFLILSLPYGFGALICRELVVRWKKGWLSLLLLGVAYGIYEEALVVYSIFDPNWTELGNLARYGFFAGVNWTWGLLTVHFHALISIAASVVLSELLFPERRGEPWLGRKALIGCFAGLLPMDSSHGTHRKTIHGTLVSIAGMVRSILAGGLRAGMGRLPIPAAAAGTHRADPASSDFLLHPGSRQHVRLLLYRLSDGGFRYTASGCHHLIAACAGWGHPVAGAALVRQWKPLG